MLPFAPIFADSHDQDSCEVISLMLQYFNDELPLHQKQEVETLINSSPAHRKLFEQVSFFFDDAATFLYEITHQEELAESRKWFFEFAAKQCDLDGHVPDCSSAEFWNDEFSEENCTC